VAIFDGTTDGDQVTVKKVYVPSIDLKPSSSIHARSPRTQWGYQTRTVAIIKVSGGSIQGGEPKGPPRVVVKAQVDIRVTVGCTASKRSSKGDRLYAGHASKSRNYTIEDALNFPSEAHLAKLTGAGLSNNQFRKRRASPTPAR
jgi:hypothetical protein